MRRPGRATSALMGILVSGALALACDREEPAPAEDTTVETVPTSSLDVTDLALGRSIGADKKVVEEVGDFAPTDTIYASVETSGTGSGTLVARWTFEDGQVVDEGTQSVSGPAVTEFHVSKPDGWPAGHYEVVILLDGAEVERSGFDVMVGT